MKSMHFSRIISLLLFEFLLFLTSPVISQDKHKALVIIDIQYHFTHKVLDSTASESLIASINNLVEKSDYQHIIYMKSILRTLTISLQGIDADTLPNLEFDERLKIVGNAIFSKNKPDAFTSAAFNNYIKENQIKEIDIAGMPGEECIYRTALGALDHELKVNLLSNAIAWRLPENKEKSCEKLSAKGVNIIQFENIH